NEATINPLLYFLSIPTTLFSLMFSFHKMLWNIYIYIYIYISIHFWPTHAVRYYVLFIIYQTLSIYVFSKKKKICFNLAL
ncbi:MAG: hypothetical protein N7Q72_04165, partial [Spiroplasma sp. Tabriz.8]|nr:hypothetical protein [Spiroplasma sp. Tabriz.8]